MSILQFERKNDEQYVYHPTNGSLVKISDLSEDDRQKALEDKEFDEKIRNNPLLTNIYAFRTRSRELLFS